MKDQNKREEDSMKVIFAAFLLLMVAGGIIGIIEFIKWI